MTSSYRSPWPLLIGAGLVVLLALGGGAYALVLVASGDEDSSSKASTSDDESPDSPPTPSESRDQEPAPAGGASGAARRYGEAFVDVSGGKEAWLRRLTPLVSPTMREGYQYTDLSMVPDTELRSVGTPRRRPAPTPTVLVDLRYAGGLTVETTVSQRPEDGHWIITAAVPIEPDPADQEQL